MWSPVSLNDESYLIKRVSQNGVYEICLSDCIYIWSEELASRKMYDRCKYLNPLMEGDEENLIQWIISLLEDEKNIKIHKADNIRVLEMNSKMGGINFSFKFYLNLASPEILYQELTLPLLLIIHQLQEQKRSLIEIITKKDMEISEYKMLGAELIRKSIETPPFKEQEFEKRSSEEPCFSDKVVKEPITVFTQSMHNLFLNTLKKYECARKKLQETAVHVTENGVQSSASDSSPEKRRHSKIEDDYLTGFMPKPPKKECWPDQEVVNTIKEEEKRKEIASKAKLKTKKKQQKKLLPL